MGSITKQRTIYTCQGCGFQSPKWIGKCPDCGGWNLLVEEKVEVKDRVGHYSIGSEAHPVPINRLNWDEEERKSTNIAELDRVLGGGLVCGSVVLVGGDPGIGKSTLLLDALNRISENGHPTMYVSGEESVRQTKMRGERLGVNSPNLYVLAESSYERIEEEIKGLSPEALVIDSIQTIYSGNLESPPGSISQIREVTGRFVNIAKSKGISIFLVGHVTKEGAIAGPRLLEHMVDTVLYFEGDRDHVYRILRAVKNRFGPASEIGVFRMEGNGLKEVENPSSVFLSSDKESCPGSVVVISFTGSRPILIEIQALVSPTNYAMPQRTAIGVDRNKVSLLVAVIERKLGLRMVGHDIFVNIVGGLRVEEPAVDLGLVAALVGSLTNRTIPLGTALFGEVGLTGEVRCVMGADRRVKEAAKLGFSRCIIPEGNCTDKGSLEGTGIEIFELNGLDGLMEFFSG